MTLLQFLSMAPLVVMLVIAAIIDWRSRRIPNWLTLVIVLSGLGSSLLPGHVTTLGQAGLGLVVGFALPFVLYALGALGGGDVKLLAGIGAWLGPWGVFLVFCAEAVVGMIIVIIQATKQKRLSALVRNSTVLTVNMINIDRVGADAVVETGKACKSVERPLPYAVPVLIAVLIVLAMQY